MFAKIKKPDPKKIVPEKKAPVEVNKVFIDEAKPIEVTKAAEPVEPITITDIKAGLLPEEATRILTQEEKEEQERKRIRAALDTQNDQHK